MADPIGFYNSHYTGGEIDAAVKQTKQNEDDIKAIKIDIAANQNEISSLKENLETNTNNINHLNGIVAQQNTALNELQAAIKPTYRHVIQLSKEDNQHLINAVLVVYSSNSTEVNSLENLKALLGNTFKYPVNGTAHYAGDKEYATIYMNKDNLYTMNGFISLTGITFTDTFTEI